MIEYNYLLIIAIVAILASLIIAFLVRSVLKKNKQIQEIHLQLDQEKRTAILAQEKTREIENELSTTQKLQKQNQEKFENWFLHFPHPLFIWKNTDNDFQMIQANKKAYHESNGNIEKIFNIPSRALWKEETDLTEYLFECFRSKKTINFERKYKFRGSGKERYVSSTYSYIPPDSVQIATIDITQRKLAKQSLRESKQKLQIQNSILNNAQELSKTGGWFFDIEKKEMHWTEEVFRIHGLSYKKNTLNAEALIQKSITCYQAEHQELIRNNFNNCLRNGIPYENVHKFTDFTGTKKWVKTGGKAVFENGKQTAVLGYIADVTESIERKNELKLAKKNAEESDRLKTKFIHNMSHEIRTPMNGILGFSSFLNAEGLSEEKKQHYLKVIQQSGTQLVNIIDDILEISLLETETPKVHLAPVYINTLLIDIHDELEAKAKDKNIILLLRNTNHNAEKTIHSDYDKLYRIITKLVDNAIKFTFKGYVAFGYTMLKNEIVFFVEDTGIGISENNQKHIFDRFSQESKELKSKIGGLGLGLPIAHANAKLLGGNIEVQSVENNGSIFSLCLPLSVNH